MLFCVAEIIDQIFSIKHIVGEKDKMRTNRKIKETITFKARDVIGFEGIFPNSCYFRSVYSLHRQFN